MRIGDPAALLSRERFRLIRDMINRRCGIFFSEDSHYLMESRLGERLVHFGLSSFDDYYHHLRYHPEGDKELEMVVDLLTTNETYFFREEYQLRSFAADLLPEMHRRLGRRRR